MTRNRGEIKVMVGRKSTRIQEETEDGIKIYSPEDWAIELKERSGKVELPEQPIVDKTKKVKKVTNPSAKKEVKKVAKK